MNRPTKGTMASAAAGLLMCLPLAAQTLPGTKPLTLEADFAAEMVRGIDRFLTRETQASIERRQKHWKRDFSSPEAYLRSVAPNRQRFRKIIGVVDPRVEFDAPVLVGTTRTPSLVGTGAGYEIHAVRWPALDGVDAEGLLLEPDGPPVANVVALPDADWSPEMLVGLSPGVPPEAQFARRLAENGCRVLVPVLIDRADTWSGNPDVRLTNLPHREMVFRMAFELGRHIIGYEVQKVLAAVDWFKEDNPRLRVGVFGYGEGGLVALYAVASDTRVDSAAVSGYFDSRQDLWSEPFYRNVWGLLEEFGDAELTGLVAPRSLVIEASHGPVTAGPRPASEGKSGNAAPGKLRSPPLDNVRREVDRVVPFFEKLNATGQLALVVSGGGNGPPGTDASLVRFLRALGATPDLKPGGPAPRSEGPEFDPTPRLRRQFDQLIQFTQKLARRAEFKRREFWAKADPLSLENWDRSLEPYRRYLWEEAIGRFPPPSEPMEARTRRIYDQPKWTGYEVHLPVWPDVFAYGILLVPKDLKPGEKRPVVVCQHGVNRRVRYVVDPTLENAYHHFAARLAERGFITYAPQNPYVGEPEIQFRLLQRKAHPIKKSIFSVILGQHERTLEWLSGLPFVDPKRIGFYGLSYGGETALRVPPLLKKYALSVCSGNFNEWVWKTTSWDHRTTFLYGGGYDHYDFDIGNTFNCADLANMMAPRPFMVERGHRDGVGPDEWVAYEYAKVRRHYAELGIPERTSIEFFNGGHEINAQGTFEFLHRHLNWPEPDE